MPTISVIVPVYNTEKYLHRCIDSILAQTFADYELLLVDDGSTDRSGAICEEYAVNDKRIRVFHQRNQGQAVARNFALDWVFANSDSEYIAFIDSDDCVHPLFLQMLFRGISSGDVNICQCRYKLVPEKGIGFNEVSPLETPSVIQLISTDEAFSQHFSGYMCDKLFKRECWEIVRFPVGQIFEDVAICYKLLFARNVIAFIDFPLYYYYQRSDGTTNKTWTPAKLAQIDAWEDQLRFAKQHGSKPVLQTVLKRFCWVYKHQCEEIAVSNNITEKERVRYSSRLLRRLRVILLQYRQELREIGIYSNYFSWAFPKLNRFYWISRGIWGKLKELFRT